MNAGTGAFAAPIGILPAIVALSVGLAGCALGSKAPRPDYPRHHTLSGFRNRPAVPAPSQLAFVLDRLRLVLFATAPDAAPGFALGQQKVQAGWTRSGQADAVLWIGHATVLLRLGGRTILTDPVFANYLTPIPPFGPRRLLPPAMSRRTLPPIDVILISHNHYDHFEPATIRKIAARDRPLCLVPLKMVARGETLGCRRLVRFDWGETFRFGTLTFRFLPAQHDSGRGLFDRNRSLWGSWMIVSRKRRVYFAGDTGYGLHFASIARRFGPIDLAILPIAAYVPRAVNRHVHLDPAQALKAFVDLKARRMLPIHWGTYAMGVDPPFAAPAKLVRRAARQELNHRLWFLRIGEARKL